VTGPAIIDPNRQGSHLDRSILAANRR